MSGIRQIRLSGLGGQGIVLAALTRIVSEKTVEALVSEHVPPVSE